MRSSTFAAALARCLMADEQAIEPAVERAARLLGRKWRWLRPLAQRYLDVFDHGAVRPSHRKVIDFLRGDASFAQSLAKHKREIRIAQWLKEPQRMQPVDAARGWKVPAIESAGGLADWLGLAPDELDWFADLKGLCAKIRIARLRHYHIGC